MGVEAYFIWTMVACAIFLAGWAVIAVISDYVDGRL